MRRRFFNNNIDNIEYFDINDYLTIEALEDNLQIYFPYKDLMYGIDGFGWQKLIAGKYSPPIKTGQTISFKGNIRSTPVNINSFTITKRCNLLGNCMSLTSDDVPHFLRLFINCNTIVNISKDFLPATTLISGCYNSMFHGCTGLKTAPELPATTLADNCYYHMFYDCTSLTTAPELPSTTLADSCYCGMFQGCTGLKTAPELPATTLVHDCYSGMFQGCSRLTTAPELPATTLAGYCYQNMFYGCTSLTTAPKLPATTLISGCYSGMFQGCTSLTTAPELPATTLAGWCYSSMFKGCTGLTTAPTLPATTLADNCYYNMFSSCTSLTTAPELPATFLPNYCYNSMFYNCSNLNYIKMLATDISENENSCLSYWVIGVASSGTFIKHPDMTSLPSGNSGIPSGWTVEDYVESNLITFTIDGFEYQAEEGMTWADWYVSNYNSGIISKDMNPPKDSIYENLDESVMIAVGEFCDEYGNSVCFGDVIIKNHTYKPRNTPPPL